MDYKTPHLLKGALNNKSWFYTPIDRNWGSMIGKGISRLLLILTRRMPLTE